MAGATWMLQPRREGPWEDCGGRNAIMWTNVVKSEKADYVWIQMLGAWISDSLRRNLVPDTNSGQVGVGCLMSPLRGDTLPHEE